MQQNFIKMIDKNIAEMEKDYSFLEKAEQEIQREEGEQNEMGYPSNHYSSNVYSHHQRYNQSTTLGGHHASSKSGVVSHSLSSKINKPGDGRYKNESNRNSTGQFIRGSSAAVDNRRA